MNLVEELKKEGRDEGRDETALKIARKMQRTGMDEALILQLTDLTRDELYSGIGDKGNAGQWNR